MLFISGYAMTMLDGSLFKQNDDYFNRVSTHDVLQMDGYYCKKEDLEKNQKYTLWCGGHDQLGYARKFFYHRVCDGIRDCINDGRDESKLFCKEAQE